MKKNLTELDFPPEMFPDTPVNALEVMERDRELYRSVELFDDLKSQGKWDKVRKVGNFIYSKFGLELSAD